MFSKHLVVRSRGPDAFDPELRDQAVIRKVHIPALKDQVTQGRDEGRFQELLEPLVPRRIECVAVEMERIVTIHGTKRSEEHTPELQSLMRISYAVFCLQKKMKLKTQLFS